LNSSLTSSQLSWRDSQQRIQKKTERTRTTLCFGWETHSVSDLGEEEEEAENSDKNEETVVPQT
jgi:hypothetical protein